MLNGVYLIRVIGFRINPLAIADKVGKLSCFGYKRKVHRVLRTVEVFAHAVCLAVLRVEDDARLEEVQFAVEHEANAVNSHIAG